MNVHERIAAARDAAEAGPPVVLPGALRDERLLAVAVSRPRVSFVLTSYNYGRYITDCLASVSGQDYDNWECLVVDDASTDDSVARVRAFLATVAAPERFRLIERPANGGQMEAFRDGLARATGSFVVMLDADDVLLPDFLTAHMRAHLTVATVAMTSTNQYQINGAGEVIAGQHMDHQSKGYFRHVRQTSFQKGFWVWATSSSMVFRRSTVERVMPRDGTTFRICADYYIAHFCHLLGDSLLVPTIHGCYRRHGQNNFGSNPVLGNINSVGDLDRHPPHDLFRQTIIRHVCENRDLFYPIFMGKGLVRFLLRLVKPAELPGLVARYPEIFPRATAHYLWLATRAALARSRTPVSEKFKILPVAATRGDRPGPARPDGRQAT
ncbi:glycosyltransferase family 2 protein [Solidesulfovibrio sp. C21]|uniref:glycosyltransferase family 2 protein n=1 Tax=Solidesulfovibrio sp. C21 TaxID=3398613 RepID=UPI0039FBA8A8